MGIVRDRNRLAHLPKCPMKPHRFSEYLGFQWRFEDLNHSLRKQMSLWDHLPGRLKRHAHLLKNTSSFLVWGRLLSSHLPFSLHAPLWLPIIFPPGSSLQYFDVLIIWFLFHLRGLKSFFKAHLAVEVYFTWNLWLPWLMPHFKCIGLVKSKVLASYLGTQTEFLKIQTGTARHWVPTDTMQPEAHRTTLEYSWPKSWTWISSIL